MLVGRDNDNDDDDDDDDNDDVKPTLTWTPCVPGSNLLKGEKPFPSPTHPPAPKPDSKKPLGRPLSCIGSMPEPCPCPAHMSRGTVSAPL